MDLEVLNSTIVLCGRRKSGKSRLLRYILAKNKHLFKAIFCICPTESILPFYKDFIKKENIFESYSEKWTEKLIEKMTKLNADKSDKEASHVLLILDDVAADHNFHASKSFRKIFVRGRHLKITIIITAQYPYMIPPVARVNADYMIVGQMNQQSLEIITSEYLAGDMNRKDFIQMYHDSTSNYNFLIINNNSIKDNSNLDEIYGTLKCPQEYIK